MKLNSVLIVGAGTMGSSIAQWFSQRSSNNRSQIQIHITDKNEEILKIAQRKISKSFEKLVSKEKFTKEEVDLFLKNLTFISYDLIAKDYDLIIEAIIENLEIKKSLFQSLDQHCHGKTIFASNTSSIPIAAIAASVGEERKQKFLGLHFFNPATVMKLVEIIAHDQTDQALLTEMYDWFLKEKKRPALCKDSPGFIVNRVARNFYGEALRIGGMPAKEEHFQEIDSIMKEVGGFKMGPFELLDLIGIDVNLDVTKTVWNSFYQEPRFAPHRLQEQMVQNGRLGKKTGKGFYDYKK